MQNAIQPPHRINEIRPSADVGSGALKPKNNSILLTMAVSIRAIDGVPAIDQLTYEQLMDWCRQYDKVTYVSIESSSELGAGGSTVTWRSLESLTTAGKVDVVIFPRGFRISEHLRYYFNVRGRLRELVRRHQYLVFQPGAIFGDWAAIGCLEAKALVSWQACFSEVP